MLQTSNLSGNGTNYFEYLNEAHNGDQLKRSKIKMSGKYKSLVTNSAFKPVVEQPRLFNSCRNFTTVHELKFAGTSESFAGLRPSRRGLRRLRSAIDRAEIYKVFLGVC